MSGDHQNPSLRLALLSDFTPDFFAGALKKAAMDSFPELEILSVMTGSWEAQVLNPSSELYAFKPDVVLIACTGPAQWSIHAASPEPDASGSHLLGKCIRTWDNLKKQLPGIEIWQTNLGPMPDGIAGAEAPRMASSFSNQQSLFNHSLLEELDLRNFVSLLDWNSLIHLRGTASAYDFRLWQTANHSFSLSFLGELSKVVVARLAFRHGIFIKVLVLDLDETMWGGIVGDLGPEGIQIGQEGMGNVHRHFQLWAKQLKRQGVLLAVASHNEDKMARSAFENPEQVLKLEDFAAFRANWSPKSEMIREMSEELNIGLEAFCFLDNSPFVRNEVRTALPQVRVPELPDDPAEWIAFLSAEAIFEPETYSEANLHRTQWIRDSAKRRQQSQSYSNYEDYLASLGMRGRFVSLQKEHLPRAHQLVMRTNQFNLRTIRHSRSSLEEFINSDQWLGYFSGLEDCHGDYGWIGLLLLQLDATSPTSAFLDTWIMSCRVFERGMEHWVFDQLVRALRNQGIRSLTAEFVPSPKNGKFSGLLGELGFKPDKDGRCCLDLSKAPVHETHIKLS